MGPDTPRGPSGAQSPIHDIKAVGINTISVPANFCSARPSFLCTFAIEPWGDQSDLVPVSHQVILDTDRDGIDDYVVLNRDASGPTTVSDGRQLSLVLDLSSGGLSAFFFAEHATNTGNTVLTVCGEQVGLTGMDLLSTNVDMDVVAQDFYFGGPGDTVEGLAVTPLGERFVGIPSGDPAGGASGQPTSSTSARSPATPTNSA